MTASVPRALRLFSRVLRYALFALGFAVLCLAALAAYLVATFDPRDHHPRIVDFVREKTGRMLEIRGPTALSFWPDIGLRMGPLALTERGSEKIFAEVESARITLKLRPLLAREIVATELAVTGARVNITRDREGRLNIADFLEGEGEPPRFDIGRVAVERSTIAYHDLATEAHYEIGELRVETGRLAENVATSVTLAAIVRAANGGTPVQVGLAAGLSFDLAQKQYALIGVKADLAGTLGQEALTVASSAAKIALANGRIDGENVRVALHTGGPGGKKEAKLELPLVASDGSRAESAAAALDLTLEHEGYRLIAALSTSVEAVFASREVNLTRMDATFSALGPGLPRKGLEAAMKGDARLDAQKEDVQVRLAGRAGASNVRVEVTARGFAAPLYTFAAEVDRLDLDRYALGDTPARKATRGGRVQDFLEMLEALPASGTLRIGVLESAGTRATDVRLAVR